MSQLTAGFLQNNKSFCAVAICVESIATGRSPSALWAIPVFKRTRAIDDIQQREGSSARNPHSSSRLNPLDFGEMSKLQPYTKSKSKQPTSYTACRSDVVLLRY